MCNSKSNNCLPDGYACDIERDFLALPEIKTLINGFALIRTSKIGISGGEHSLRKDLPDIIKACSSTIGIEHVAMASNGFKLKADIQKWVNAGLDSLNISIHSLDPRMFVAITGHNKLETIMRGIDKALALCVKVKINAVLIKQYNEQELQNFLTWLKATPVTLRLFELMQTGDKKKHIGYKLDMPVQLNI